MSLLGFDPNKYKTASTAQPKPNEQGRFGDVVDSFQAGAASGLGGIFDFLGAEGVAKSLYGIADDQYGQMSSRGQEAMSKQMFTENAQGETELGDGMTDLDTWLLQMANVAGQFVPTAVPGAGAAGMATKALSLGSKGAKVAQAISMGATGGSAATGQAMDQARQEVLKMPDKVLAESDLFKRTFLEIDAQSPELDDLGKWNKAKNQLAERVASEVRSDPKALMANFAASAIGDPIIGRALTGVRLAKSGAFRSALAGGVTEGATEAAQAGVSQYAVDNVLSQIDQRDPMAGVKLAALNEGIIGAGFGAGAGGIGGLANRNVADREPAKNPAADPIRETNPTVAGAMDADAQQAADRRADVDNMAQASQQPNYDQPTAARRAGMGDSMNAGRFGDDVIARDNAMKGRSFPTVPGQFNQSPLAQAMDNVQGLTDNRREGEWLPPEGQGRSPVTGLLAAPFIDGENLNRQRTRDTMAAQPTNLIGKSDTIFGTDGRPMQAAQQFADQVTRDNAKKPLVIEDKGIIFAPDNFSPQSQGVNVKTNNTPFASAKEALASKNARIAKREGAQVEAVKLDSGFGWRVVPKRDSQNADQAANKEYDGASPEPVTASPVATDAKVQPAKKPDADTPDADTEESPTKRKVLGLAVDEASIDELTISDDVPQFKSGANSNGVVEPLGGKFERTGVAPIQVWVRSDGRKEVISGRHRLDLARRSGEKTIPAQYHYEADGFSQLQAAALDATLNIREGQGKVKDYVDFIQATTPTQEEANAQGLLARATGKRAYSIATKGSDALITAHRNDVITDEAATRIADAAPNNEALQAVGIKSIQEGRSIGVAENMVKAVKSMTSETQQQSGDLFGFDDSAMREAEALARKANSKQSDIQRTLSAVQGAAKRPDLAAKEGVDVKDPKAVNARIEQLKQQKQQWDNWHTNPALVAELKGESFDLAQETESDRAQRESESQKEAETKRQRDNARTQMFEADRQVDSFTLTGSNRDADVAMAAGQNDMFSQPTVKPTKPESKLDNLADSISDKQRAAAEKLKALLAKKKGTLNSGIDPEIMVAVAEVGALSLANGAVKFAQWVRDILNVTRAIGIQDEDVTPFLKEAYGAIAYNPDRYEISDNIADNMDSPRAVAKLELSQILAEVNQDAERTAGNPQSNRLNRSDADQRNDQDLQREGRGQSRSDVNDPSTATGRGEAGASVGDSVPTVNRKSSNQSVRHDKPRVSDAVTGSIDSAASLPDSTGGLFAEQNRHEAPSVKLSSAPSLTKKVSLNAFQTITSADKSQIKNQMPFLSDGQVDDVVFAEKRLSKEDGYGVLFTNGTGTGKTFTGLGVVKRAVESGKGRILIAVPKQAIADAWVKAGKQFFDLTVNPLESTKDAGQDVVVTTFANLSANDALLHHDFDMIVLDEAHYLSSSADGKVTGVLTRIRALAKKPGYGSTIVKATNPDSIMDRLNEAREERERIKGLIDSGRADGNMVSSQDKIIDKLWQEFYAHVKEVDARLANTAPKDMPRALMLSATPFAYEKNVTLGQGFLFDWNEGKGDNSGSGYNSGDNFDQFMMQHFGYRMRYNKLTEPDAKVDRSLMQRAFNAWLKKQGVLSGRALDSDFDYDRKFILAESRIGQRVDEAIEWLWDKAANMQVDSPDDDSSGKFRDLIIGKNFHYQSRMYFLEAIKAREAIATIQANLDLGRKVVVMHDFNKGGAVNPFRVNVPEEMRAIHNEFKQQFADLINAFDSLPSAIETLTAAFPDASVYNGSVSAKNRIKMQDDFNRDTADSAKLLIAQGDAMREGVSIHDTSGKHQRVLIHLGMPTKPTAAIQQEGRIYRTGQASDALFRYLTIGTNWERFAFASKIATRASTAENLAMGDGARGLKQAFISAYEEADAYPPSVDEGKGGKAADAAMANVLTPWDLAKALYFGTKKYGSGRSSAREGTDYFATPEPVGLKMVAFLDPRGGDKLLEPSGGHGAIARWFPENTENRSIEQSSELASRLSLNFDGDVITGSFENHNIINKYDGIAMNPPYGVGGKTAAEHVEKAMNHLRNGGRIVALIPTGPAADKKFDKLLYESDAAKDIYQVANIILPKSTFERAGTSVATRILVLEKQTDPDKVNKIHTHSTMDYSNLESNEALFSRLEDLDLGERTAPRAEEVFASTNDTLSADKQKTIIAPGDAVANDSVHKMNSKHTKSGDDLFVVNFDADMGDNYNAYSELAKANGGFYVRAMMRHYYKPADGKSVPGKPTFVFKSDLDREAFMQAIAPASESNAKPDSDITDGLLFSKTNSKGKNKGARLFSQAEAQRAVDDVLKRLSGAAGIRVNLFTSQDEFLSRFNVPAMAMEGQTIYGAYDDRRNSAYLILDNFSSIDELRSTLVHEVLAHGGLHTVIGAQKYQQFINKLNSSRSRKEFKELWARIDKDYAGASDAVKAEEVFANFVQNQPERGTAKAWWFELTKWLRRQLEGFGIIKSNITRNEMEDMMASIVRGFKNRKSRMDRANKVLDARDEAPTDILFSKTTTAPDDRTAKQKLGLEEEAAQTLKEKITENYRNTADTLKQSSFWSRLNEGVFDGLHGIKKAEEAAGITDPNKMGYVSARLASGLSDVLHGVFHYGAPMWKDGIIQRKKDTKGLLEVFGMLPDGELNNWLAWMGANRAKQLKAQGRENNLSQADIDELLALADGKEKLFEEVRTEYNKINSAVLDVAQGAGLISEAQRSGFDEEYYVPFFREQDVDPEMQDIASMVTAPFTKKGIAGQSAKIKTLKGGSQSTKDLLENIILRQSTMLDAALKNKAMLEVSDNLDGTQFMTQVDSPEFAKLSQRELNSIQRVKVMRDGQAVAYAVTDPALLRGLIAVNDVGSQALFNRMGRSAKRFLTTGVTLSPDFIFKNFIRDAAHAWMINKDDFKFGTDSIKGLKKAFKEDEAYRDLIFSGAAFQGGYVHGADPEAAAQQIRRALSKKGLSDKQINSYMGTLVTSGKALIEKYRNASDKVENANRLSTYEASLAAGKSRRQAAFEAKDLMDYAMKGNFALISTMIDFLPFFNARLQGMYKLARASAAGENDKVLKVLSANLAMKGIKVAAFSLALAAMNDDDDRYKELPDWDKDANWHFWVGEDHFRIPKPFELGVVFGTLPERLFGFGTGSQTGSDLGRATAHAVFNTMALNPIPQIALPVVEVMTNKSFFKDAPIEGMGDEQRMPGDRYNAYTSDIARELGQLFNVSPKKIEHLVNGYAGTLGGYVLAMSDMMARQMLGIEKAETPISRYPVIKAFYGGDAPAGSTYYQAEFYKALDAANQAYGSYKRAAEERDSSRIMGVLEDNRDKLGVRIALNRVQRQVSALGKQAEMVNNSSMSASEKREKLDAITRQKNAIYQRAYIGFNLREW
ncbi:DEAD/DEAH box helicase family protein [Shewanella sp. SW32]|uniref:LPD38 domain-containing protein n=1 Tax=unclassified Shewanella TaxID=196818 RepID=UPI0021D87F3A|nr:MULTISPECIES: LPD38 domain-containing protein [unclassified Shewanella]MCU7963591.1 DEAD/DEAH box helicase family protein [Shewanella sp. SW32]MCU7971506.1 DEAD/DEAH box helicase family protein [Shewanella sp. SW29]